jgi:type II secretory pathway component PulF
VGTSFRHMRSPSIRQRKPSARWHVRSFVVHRRNDSVVKPYRTVIYSPVDESADLGVGLSPDEVARRVSPSFWDGVGASRSVRPEEIADFWENLGLTVKGGGTEAVALSRAARMASTPRARGVIGALRWRLNQGRSFHAALGEFEGVFPKAHCALAEAATQLPPDQRAELYLSLARTLREQASRTRKFVSAMLDQFITGVMLIGLVAITLVYFVPNFAAMFRGLDLDLPYLYAVAVRAGEFASRNASLILVSTIAFGLVLFVGGKAALKTPPVQRAIAGLPVLGPLVRNLALARSLPLFAVLHRAGVHPELSFRLAGEASGNARVEGFFVAAYERCSSGMDMEKAFLAERLRLGLTEGRRLAGKVEAGGEIGDLEGVLKGLAAEFSESANAKIEAVPKVVKPINLAAMGLVVGLMAALVGLPSMLVLEKTFRQQNEKSAKQHAVAAPQP